MEIDTPKPESKDEVNKLRNVIGELGKWQVIMLLVIHLPTFMTMSWMQLGIIFLAPNTTYICVDQNITKVETPLKQKCYDGCDKYEYYTEFRNTIISQWDLICDRAWMVQFSQTTLMFGALLGSIVFGFISDRNNLPSENMLDVVKIIASEDHSSRSQEDATYLDLFKAKFLKYTLCSCTIWFMNSVVFDGGNQYIGLTSSNPFISMCTAGALQIPGAILSAILCKYIGRRLTLIILWIVCSFMYALLAVYNDWVYFKLVVGSIALTCIGGAFSCLYLFTSELFPTVTRNMGLGASYAVSGVGSMLAPFISGLAVKAAWIPPSVFAIAPILATLACYCLPETKGIKLSDHLD